ncbi:unnamed protein product [Rangifer tarandus platyrhynchus]|uniref:Uncharacterized protein n=1 Tax=Rangifer tarandus platyrhynchus TaxID=3082113 RepID=A0AC59ZWJ2_RANTA
MRGIPGGVVDITGSQTGLLTPGRNISECLPHATYLSMASGFHSRNRGLKEQKSPSPSSEGRTSAVEEASLPGVSSLHLPSVLGASGPQFPLRHGSPLPATRGGCFPILSLTALRAARIKPFGTCKGSAAESHLPAALQLPEDSGPRDPPWTWLTSASTPALGPCLLRNE